MPTPDAPDSSGSDEPCSGKPCSGKPLEFDDLAVGYVATVGSCVVPLADAIEFARRWEPQPHHIDPDAAGRSIYAGITLCSLQLFAICTRLFFDWKSQPAVLAMLGKDEIRLPNPARPDEQIVYRTECISRRESRSKPDRGVVTLLDTLSDPRGDPVLTQKVTLLVPRRLS
jgi:acyl dehydratase